MTTLTNRPIGPLLHRLFASAEQNDEKVMATWRAKNEHRREQISSRQRAEELSDAYLPISPEVGRLLYVLARNKQARTIVEFGTSFGISTIHLGAFLQGYSRIVTRGARPPPLPLQAEHLARQLTLRSLRPFDCSPWPANLPDLYERAAFYVDKILKGAKPGELPVEQPTRFQVRLT